MTTTRASAAAADVANTKEAATVASKQDATTTPTMQPNDAAEYVAETSANKPINNTEASSIKQSKKVIEHIATLEINEKERKDLFDSHVSKAPAVRMAFGVVLCFVNIEDGDITNLNVNQAAPQDKRIETLLKSFTKHSETEMKSFSNDKMVAYFCCKSGFDKKDFKSYELSETVSAFQTALNGVNKSGKMSVSPFAVNEAVTNIIEALRKASIESTEIKEALTADVTTVNGQKKLLRIARRKGWFEKGKGDRVQVADRDGVDGMLNFRDAFSSALSFFWASVEGNHRVITGAAALHKCKPRHDSPIKIARRGEDHFLTGQDIGVESVDPLEELHAGSTSLVTHFNTPIYVDVLGSKLQATELAPAKTLERQLLLSISKTIADEKHASSQATLAIRYSQVAMRFSPDKDKIAQKSDGSFYCDGEEIEEKSNKDILDPKEGAFQSNKVLNDYVNDSSPFGEPLKRVLSTLHFNEEDTDARIALPARMDANTAMQNAEAKSVKRAMSELIGTANATVMSFSDREKQALLLSNKFYDNTNKPMVKLNEKLAEKLGLDLPELFEPDSEKSIDLSVLHFITEWMVAANMNNNLELLQQALDKLSRELSNMGEKDVKECLARCYGLLTVRAIAMVQIIGYSYFDKQGRNNLQKTKELEQSVQKTYNKNGLGEMMRSQLVYEFLETYEKYGLNSSIAETHITNGTSELYPKQFKKYLTETRSEQRTDDRVRKAFASAMQSLKGGNDIRTWQKLFNSKRTETPKNLELALMLLFGGTMRIRMACDVLSKNQEDAFEVAKLELGDIEFHEREDAPLSNQFCTKKASARNAKPMPMKLEDITGGQGARNLSDVCSAMFDGETYEGGIMMENNDLLATIKEKYKKKKKRKAANSPNGESKKSKPTNATQGNIDSVDEKDSEEQQKEEKEDAIDDEQALITVTTSHDVGTTGNDEDDKTFVSKRMIDLGLNWNALSEEAQLSLVQDLKNYFTTVIVDGNENYGQEQKYYNEHLAGMILGDYKSDITTMREVLDIAYKNAKNREKNEYSRGVGRIGLNKTERQMWKDWEKNYGSDTITVRDKMLNFAETLNIQVTLISAMGTDWSKEVLGEEGELPALTILAKTDNTELQNDSTTNYYYYVPEDPSE